MNRREMLAAAAGAVGCAALPGVEQKADGLRWFHHSHVHFAEGPVDMQCKRGKWYLFTNESDIPIRVNYHDYKGHLVYQVLPKDECLMDDLGYSEVFCGIMEL